jgi:ribosome-associated toxin RatA of RatAB toxin-antitoxin module
MKSAAMLAAILLTAALPPLSADALARLRAGRVVVESEDDGTAGSTHAWALARCGPEAIWAVITDHAHFPDFVPHLEKMEIIQHSASAERSVQTVDAVVATVRYALDYRFDKEHLRIDYQLVPELPHDIAAARGAWQLWPTEEGTLIEYSSAVDTGRSVPGFIRSYLARSAAADLLEAVRKRARP